MWGATSVLDDNDLLARIQGGDIAALAVLYDCHGDAVYTFALHLVGAAATAERAVQDTFLALWQGTMPERRGYETVRMWLLAGVYRHLPGVAGNPPTFRAGSQPAPVAIKQ